MSRPWAGRSSLTLEGGGGLLEVGGRQDGDGGGSDAGAAAVRVLYPAAVLAAVALRGSWYDEPTHASPVLLQVVHTLRFELFLSPVPRDHGRVAHDGHADGHRTVIKGARSVAGCSDRSVSVVDDSERGTGFSGSDGGGAVGNDVFPEVEDTLQAHRIPRQCSHVTQRL